MHCNPDSERRRETKRHSRLVDTLHVHACSGRHPPSARAYLGLASLPQAHDLPTHYPHLPKPCSGCFTSSPLRRDARCARKPALCPMSSQASPPPEAGWGAAIDARTPASQLASSSRRGCLPPPALQVYSSSACSPGTCEEQSGSLLARGFLPSSVSRLASSVDVDAFQRKTRKGPRSGEREEEKTTP